MPQDQKDKQIDEKWMKDVAEFGLEKPISVHEVGEAKAGLPEVIPAPETKEKIKIELPKTEKQKIKEMIGSGAQKSTSPAMSASWRIEAAQIKEVESILEEGLKNLYSKMDPITQMQFKEQGEDTAKAINILLQKTKVKVKEIIKLIIKWLRLIPGINKFFIEQEAKIKADKLLAMKRKGDKGGLEIY